MGSQSQPTPPDGFSIDFDLDQSKRRLTLKLAGKIVSQQYFDRCVAYYSKIGDPSRLDRLIDCTESKGYVNFDHLNALSDL